MIRKTKVRGIELRSDRTDLRPILTELRAETGVQWIQVREGISSENHIETIPPLIVVRHQLSPHGVLIKARGNARNRWQCAFVLDGVQSKRFEVACGCCLWLEHHPITKEPLIQQTLQQLDAVCGENRTQHLAVRKFHDRLWQESIIESGANLHFREFSPHADFHFFGPHVINFDREAEKREQEAVNRRIRKGWKSW